jgi:5-(carboxyamino)imidazole ribonucleotide synthase
VTALGPGSTIGVLGGGQLGWMLALEAQRMGYRTVVLDPSSDSSASRAADRFVTAEFDDLDAARAVAAESDVTTVEFERIPHQVLADLERNHIVRPSSNVLRIVQDRLTQRRFLQDRGFPQPRFGEIESKADLASAGAVSGFPAIMKSSRGGYDGKNQARVESADQLEAAWDHIGGGAAVLERFVAFDKEISVVLARDVRGNVACFPTTENEHRHHILFTSVAPARITEALRRRAEEIATGVAEALDYRGVMAVEMFVESGEVLINEVAPRVHNSGHYTFGACATSQFEQHIRAICGLALGYTTMPGPAAMLNLLGELWSAGEPSWETLLAEFPSAKLFLYGKHANSPRRKMGHVLFTGPRSADAALNEAMRAYDLLASASPERGSRLDESQA